MIPSFILSKLYVKGSLKNTAAGFEFALKNIVDATMLSGFGPIVTGDQSYEGAVISMTVGDKTYNGGELSRQNPAPVRMGAPMTIRVQGQPLAAGAQHLSVSAITTDIGKIKFDINDTVA
jgi:hypothetical protein